eukprot:4108491-Amphidinium_carterae.1
MQHGREAVGSDPEYTSSSTLGIGLRYVRTAPLQNITDTYTQCCTRAAGNAARLSLEQESQMPLSRGSQS